LWSRIVFNMLVSNTDDHLRNHGFILAPARGWRLSAAYDMNAVPDGQGMRLNVSEADNAQELELARAVARYFRVTAKDATAIIERCRRVVRQWPDVASRLRLPAREQERMAPAFRLAQ
jgi:serine/threonine-protein kinase HipA